MTADLHQAREALRAAERALQAQKPDHEVASAWASVADTWVAVHHAARPGDAVVDTSGSVMGATATFDWTTEHTAEEWAAEAARLRAEAKDQNARRIESQERSDTDGFLSQWAHDQLAYHYQALARMADDGGVSEQYTLYRDGEPVPCRQVEGQYGTSWAIYESWAMDSRPVAYVGVSVASTPKREAAHYARKGYTLGLATFALEQPSMSTRIVRDYARGPIAVVTADALA